MSGPPRGTETTFSFDSNETADTLATRVAEALRVFEGDTFLNGMSTEIQISRLTKQADQDFWTSLASDIEQYLDAKYKLLHEKAEVKIEPQVIGTENIIGKLIASEIVPSRVMKHWGDFDTSDDDSDALEELQSLTKGSVEHRIIRVPDDMEAIWPRGFNFIAKACNKYNFTLIKDRDVTFRKCGFADTAAFSEDKATRDRYISTLSNDEQIAISTLKSLVYFIHLQPNEVLAKSSQLALSASYALHFLVKGESEEEKDLIKKSLKHSDGGKTIISMRISSRFKTGSSAPIMILNAMEKLYSAVAKNYTVTDENEFTLVLQMCFTSHTGLIRSFYRKVTRKETVTVEDTKPNGKKFTKQEKKLVRGLDAPKLHLGSEFMKVSEVEALKKYERSFPNENSIVTDVLKKSTSKDFLLPAKIARVAVERAYAISDRIHKVLKYRKEVIRAECVSEEGKIRQSEWIRNRESIVMSCEPISDEIYEMLNSYQHFIERESLGENPDDSI